MMINGETIWVVVDNIVDDVKDLLMYFSLKEVQYPPRDCNTMTHVSTYFALHEQSRNYQLEEGPEQLMNCIIDILIVTNAFS